MIRPELLNLLQCLHHHVDLKPAGEECIAQINSAIANKKVKNFGGEVLRQPLHGGVMDVGERVLYPITKTGLPMMLADFAIDLQQAALQSSPESVESKPLEK